MLATRTAARSARALSRRTPQIRSTTQKKFESTGIPNPNHTSSSAPASSSSGALVGGLAGGALVFTGGYAWYHFSGAKTLVSTSKSISSSLSATKNKLKESAPEPNEALEWLRSTTQSYAAFIPGAKGYVDTAFNDLDSVRAKHGDEVDKIVKEAYGELKEVSGKEMTLQTAAEAWDIIQKRIAQIMELAGDAAQDILNNHPEIKSKVGGSVDQLKQMGDQYGPEAKKQVDQTFDQIKDIMSSGLSADTATKIKKVVEEKIELVKKMGDEAWKKGLEQAKPYLDKNPKVKEMIEQNKDSLMQGNMGELWEKVKNAVNSGNTDDLEKYVKSAAGKAKDSGMGGLDKYLNMVPGAEKIVPQLKSLSEVAQKHGKEAEDLLKETVDEISKVLSNKSEKAQEIAKKAEKEAK
ncbi:hypothetical protein BU16DRAFT_531903 [Lophium mytilinum]|uniref:Apolipoprotein/apolipophorin n=1 Tax=Lophium mytilinum TaxID=390894 RepID=A0A6A6Q971_9PEZI|nr:hypothetical protein BU16DRAFT_531903 [Lophium mytilinum]